MFKLSILLLVSLALALNAADVEDGDDSILFNDVIQNFVFTKQQPMTSSYTGKIFLSANSVSSHIVGIR